jgi:hypothetical protein
MATFNFDDIRASLQEPVNHVITKIEIFDGVDIDLYEGSFSCLNIGPDPDNDGRITMWYTEPSDLNQPSINVQIRLFMAGQKVSPRLHHYLGAYNFDGDLRFIYLDRTRDHRAQQQEMRSILKQATGEINNIVEQFLEHSENEPDLDRDDFIRKLLSDIRNETEEGR